MKIFIAILLSTFISGCTIHLNHGDNDPEYWKNVGDLLINKIGNDGK